MASQFIEMQKLCNFTQMNIRADRPRLEAGEQLLRLRLDNDQRGESDQMRLLFDGAPPALLG